MFEFALGPVAHCATGPTEVRNEHEGLPPDLHEVIGTAGDQFRDPFTRMCLYLVLSCSDSNSDASDERTDDTIVIGTEYGNTAALARLQRDAETKGRLLSAQHFPNATSSSASAFVNLRVGATGRNMTLNAGVLTPVVAMWQALSALDRERSAVSRLLIGDVYAPEAVEDALLDTPGLPCSDGVTHAFLLEGTEFTAEFGFGATDDANRVPVRTVRRTGAPGGPAVDAEPVAFEERNGAFATRAFLDQVHSLAPAERAVLECRARDGRHATVTVTRRQTNSTNGRSA